MKFRAAKRRVTNPIFALPIQCCINRLTSIPAEYDAAYAAKKPAAAQERIIVQRRKTAAIIVQIKFQAFARTERRGTRDLSAAAMQACIQTDSGLVGSATISANGLRSFDNDSRPTGFGLEHSSADCDP